MIYVSSSCSKQKKIGPAIQELAEYGFRNIELTGGTEYYQGYEDDILEMKEKYDLNFLIHNYFPPPEEPFVLNLASLNNEIFEKSVHQILRGIRLAKLLGTNKFGFHAGFFIDVEPNELGKTISGSSKWDRLRSLRKFCKGFDIVAEKAGKVELYIENNVYSKSNLESLGRESPFMLISASDYEELQQHIEFKLLLDVAHLYVSAKTLDFSFQSDLNQLITQTDYVHLSDNDGYHDQNLEIGHSSKIMHYLKKEHIKDKMVTLEIWSGLDKVADSFNYLVGLINQAS